MKKSSIEAAKDPSNGGSVRRLVRVPWSAEEDESIKLDYAVANGAFNTYRSQADELNKKFHSGKPVRSAASVRWRERKLLTNTANDQGLGRRSPDSESTNQDGR